MTHRQYEVWTQWLEDEWNQPNRTDHYLMQISQRVASVLSDKPEKIKAEMFKLEFKREPVEKKPEREFTEAEHIAYSKASWFYSVGYRG